MNRFTICIKMLVENPFTIFALRQIGLMSNICQVIIRLPGFLYTLFHYSYSSLYYAFRAALRLLVLPVLHLDIACSSLIF